MSNAGFQLGPLSEKSYTIAILEYNYKLWTHFCSRNYTLKSKTVGEFGIDSILMKTVHGTPELPQASEFCFVGLANAVYIVLRIRENSYSPYEGYRRLQYV